MKDWRSPGAKIRGALRTPLFHLAMLHGVLDAQTPEDLATVKREEVPFFGNRPGVPGPLGWHREHRRAYREPRPVFEIAHDIFYSRRGMAWRGGRLVERFSVLPITMNNILASPPKAHCLTIPRCAIVQSDFVYSYGDWVHCYLGVILSADFADVPVLVPDYLAAKSYVQRDLAAAGIKYIVANDWVRIEECFVLRKRNPLSYWSPVNVQDFRNRFPISTDDPRPGSLLYLGRFDLTGETVARRFPSDRVAAYISSVGGEVVNQSELNTLSAPRFGRHAETVVGDHGSGILNIMFWRPTTVIELVVDRWWVNNSLFVAAGMGVRNFAVIEVDGLSVEEIGEKIQTCQELFAERS